MTLLILAALWFASGAASFIYWWTRKYHLESTDLPLVLMNGFTGPLAFLVGVILYADGQKPRILIRKRK
ncbi:MAG: hypothetical protein VYB88_01290 [Pseudomonadota bacterium]|uniref:hypothetical protein n=1 Tax=Ralstonia pickettii TaxID=329 RepID=UPI0027154753|nr:hypothetical protein [Ralstonia pickettii]MEE2976083.1 hypothetical protein [Pseudomonadota bacterium]WKZ83973.1 hypothetical protein N5B55_09240 [Ralstonia pickettii]